MNGSPSIYYHCPDQNDKVVKLALSVGRVFYNEDLYNKRYKKLYEHMQTLTAPELKKWSEVVMISPYFSGATGQGAYIAVASRIVNEIATEILQAQIKEWKEQYGDAFFVVKEENNPNRQTV